ncbi:MAG: (Fe-S)-binding protein, partial [Rhodocyclaceae bacterium]
MQVQSMNFKARVAAKLNDPVLQANLKVSKGKFVDKRALSITELPEFEATREAARVIRDRVLADLDVWLEEFERKATARGATVL